MSGLVSGWVGRLPGAVALSRLLSSAGEDATDDTRLPLRHAVPFWLAAGLAGWALILAIVFWAL